MSTQHLTTNKAILEIEDLVMTFGGLRAIDGVSMHIDEGEIAALIGPNGAGKTTIFNCITGEYKPTEGRVRIRDRSGRTEEIHGLKPNVINQKGLARTFQNIRLFGNMSVLENVMIGRHNSLKAGIFKAIVRDAATREEEQRVIEESYLILKKLKTGHVCQRDGPKTSPTANSGAWRLRALSQPILFFSFWTSLSQA